MPKKFSNILKEPFIQFLILGSLLFLLVTYIQKNKINSSREIVIDNNRVDLMIVNYKNQTGNLPAKIQIDAMINSYIREEILYREAKKTGLDKDDEIVRRRLSQKLEFLKTDLAEIKTPSENELKQFYTGNPILFQEEATVSFTHIYFSTDGSNDSTAKRKALIVLKDLTRSNTQHAPEKGDAFPMQYDYTDQSLLDVKQNFGDKPMVDSLFHSAINVWIGPVQSGYGWHLLFISKRNNNKLLPFESVKKDVLSKYISAERKRQNKEMLEELSKQYIIKRDYLNNK
jgi:peptidyl-prolyl cis-trans isomerase C